MKPSDWISLGALIVAGLSIVAGPWLGGRIQLRSRIRDDRSDAYAEALRLLHYRMLEVHGLSVGRASRESVPTAAEADLITARLRIYATDPVFTKVKDFIQIYTVFTAEALAKVRRKFGFLEEADRVAMADAHHTLEMLTEEIVQLMRHDLGT